MRLRKLLLALKLHVLEETAWSCASLRRGLSPEQPLERSFSRNTAGRPSRPEPRHRASISPVRVRQVLLDEIDLVRTHLGVRE
jgi:hypothetical protein